MIQDSFRLEAVQHSRPQGVRVCGQCLQAYGLEIRGLRLRVSADAYRLG